MDLKVGRKIKSLRLASDLTQEELANRARLTKGFISQLENDQSSVQIDSLADILGALGVSLTEFFRDNSDESLVFGPSERVQVDGTGASFFELLVPGSTQNLMDPIIVQLKPGEKLQRKGPHPGEQFGYVLKGTATLRLAGKEHEVQARHCFYFESSQSYQILNQSGKEMSFLWVMTPPQM